MFCAIWVCGPAAGPNGVAARRWWTAIERSRPGWALTKRCAGRSKTARLRSSSLSMRPTRTSKGTGASWTIGVVRRALNGTTNAVHHRSAQTPRRVLTPINGRLSAPSSVRRRKTPLPPIGRRGARPARRRARPRRSPRRGIAVWRRARLSARAIAASSATIGVAAGFAHRLDDFPPIVGLVVEDAVGEARRARSPTAA